MSETQNGQSSSTSTESLSDEELRKSLKPNPCEDEVVECIRRSYTKDGDESVVVKIIKQLESYDDANYLVDIAGEKFLAKVHNGVESEQYLTSLKGKDGKDSCSGVSSIDLQNAIFNHLNQEQYGITTSLPIRSSLPTNSLVSVHSLPVISLSHSPRNLVLRVLKWVHGQPMSSMKFLPIESLLHAGTYLGKICHALDDLTNTNEKARKSADRYHAWDGRNFLDVEQFLPCITNDSRRQLVKKVMHDFRRHLVDSKEEFRKGILQADFNDANIIMGEDGNVSGVIDFGDSTLSWRVLDITVAMAYAMISSYGKDNRSISAAAAMLRGFHSVYPLTTIERKYLRLLIATRLSTSVTLGAYSYQQNPQNEYLLFHAEPAWKVLELLYSQVDNADNNIGMAIDKVFHIACHPIKHDKIDSNITCSDISMPDPSIPDHLLRARVSSLSFSPLTENINQPVKKKMKSDDEISHDETTAQHRPQTITFVTGNKKKLQEVQRILNKDINVNDQESHEPLPFQIDNRKIDLPELQGDPLDIAREKCTLASKQVEGAVITEDTSLCFNALQNLPGPYIKWFLEGIGHKGLNDMIAFTQDKSAYAQTIVAFCPSPGQDVIIFDGRTQGKIVPARGPLDFGWDPIFEPDEGGGLTYAEMSKEGKDAISHRGRAFSQLREYLVKNAQKLRHI